MAFSKKNDFSSKQASLSAFADALSHPARIAILEILAKRKSCICGEIVEVLPLAQSTVSQHLKELREIGLIKGEIDGPKSCYCINGEMWRKMMAEFYSFLEATDRELTNQKCC